ncbi:uncharacterized protein TM35_000082070 [Trypanosoma theileri]|uniref:Rab-GAP TBC domain-containing protein n=1 Tax=Trypanosoma theileri TaxID=67003 RepID=A0A1X0P1L8_9TRYP|nr:uncharacterized protein TM35_000082070 [Trypanosoma theileri]ORC90409.1 hypothetical protein TM35_000082070 [Trypanosoma theileri]
MSVAIDVNTVRASLWPSIGRVTRSTGQFVDVTLIGGRGTIRFTHVVFDPSDEAIFYASSSGAVVYMFSLRKNLVKLFATLEYPITAMARCGSSLEPLFLCATEDLSLVWIDCNTSRIIRREKTAHQHVIHTICPSSFTTGSTLVATLSREALALWETSQMTCRAHTHLTVVNTIHNFMSVYVGKKILITIEWSGLVKKWDPFTLQPIQGVVVDLRPRSVAICDDYIAIGGTNALVGFLKTEDLSSIGCVKLSNVPAITCSLFIIHNDLIACELTDGTIVFVVMNTFTVAFAMAAPYTGSVPKRPTIFKVSGPSFAVFAHGEQLMVFHLPTARQYYLQRTKINSCESNPALPRRMYPFVEEKGHTRIESHTHVDDEGEDITDMTLPRPLIHPSEQQVSKWVKVNLLPSYNNGIHHKENGDAHTRETSLDPPSITLKGRGIREGQENDHANNKKKKELSLRPFLDKASREANMLKLKRLLTRYGVFPDKYRPLIWRFLLQLPEKRFTAPQYAQLHSKEKHPFVPFLMKPFPLSDKKIRDSMELVLSILIWHDSMFAVIHFLPMIIYPFLQVYDIDTQSVVEVVLIFLINWGQEFFQYYPHHPVALTTLLNQLLRTEDAELYNYLDQRGIMVENWGWEPLRSLYTDVLSSAVWLQVMDHAFFNEPLWLFVFHIQWLIHIRGKLMQIDDQQELTTAFTITHSMDVNKIISETYKMFEKIPKGELTKPYSKLHSFIDYAYPTLWKTNKEVIKQKLEDLQQSLQQREQAGEFQKRIQGVQEQLVQAETLEEVFVEKKRAKVASQFVSENESWRYGLGREKENNRLREMGNITRLNAVQQRIHSAGRLEALHEELTAAREQVADITNIREREALHWQRSERLTEQELRRLEEAARERLAKAIKAIEEDERNSPNKQSGDVETINPANVVPASITEKTTTTTTTTNITTPTNTSPQAAPISSSSSASVPHADTISSRDAGNSGDVMEAYRTMQNFAARGITETPCRSEDYTRTWQQTPPPPPPQQQQQTPPPPPPLSTYHHHHHHNYLSASVGTHFGPNAPLYDNLLGSGVTPGLSEAGRSGTSADSQFREQRYMSSDRDERSSAGTVLLRPHDQRVYRLPRPS